MGRASLPPAQTPRHYQIFILDGLVLKRKTGLGTQKRTVLVALGIRQDSKKEIIDFHQPSSMHMHPGEDMVRDLF